MKINKIGILGTGKMGQAIIKGLFDNKPGLEILAYDIRKNKTLEKYCKYVQSPEQLEVCDVILICIKPQDFLQIKTVFQGKTKYISIAAGIEISSIQECIPGSNSDSIARAMPNLAADIGKSATGIYSSSPGLTTIAVEIFETIGKTYVLSKESDMHIVTALCGSGPAFVYSFLHAMAEGGVLGGLSYKTALEMATQTLIGASESLEKSELHPAEARSMVASPAGTTIAGLHELESGAFHSTVMNAISKANKRSHDIAKEN